MPEESKESVPGFDTERKTVSFDYIKSNHFRVIHVNGGWGD
jgi:hypothetical protein